MYEAMDRLSYAVWELEGELQAEVSRAWDRRSIDIATVTIGTEVVVALEGIEEVVDPAVELEVGLREEA